MLKDIDFITYALTFGLEEPDLTDEEIYSRYAKKCRDAWISGGKRTD